MKKKIILCENVLQVLLKTHNSQSKAKKNFCQQTITIAFAFFLILPVCFAQKTSVTGIDHSHMHQ